MRRSRPGAKARRRRSRAAGEQARATSSGAAGLPLGVRAVTAILLESADPARLAAFYRDVLGVPLQHVEVPGFPPHHGAELAQVYLAILKGRRRSGASCVAFYVDDVTAAAAALRVAKVKQLAAPKRTPLGLIARFSDPDGNPFELYQP